jgi:hypothetical protein
MIGLLLSAALVWQSTQAAFTDTTSNDGNTWTAGTVVLTDDLNGTLMFNETGLEPGLSTTRCIEVTYAGDLDARVKLYGSGLVENAGLDSNADLDTLITMDIEIGTAGSTCASFTPEELIADDVTLAALDALDYSTGLQPTTNWTPDPGTPADLMRPYRFQHTLADDNAAQGDDVTMNFVWEAQNI